VISSLTIKGILSHKDTHIEFSPGVNVIVGASDVGKSSIIRSIRKVSANRPLGDGLVNWDMDRASITIKTSEGDRITRNIGKINNYVINEDKSLEAMNHGIPDQVKSLLNLDDINFSLQSTEHFLFGPSYTSGMVAKMINEVANLTLIDVSIKNTQRLTRENSDLIKEANNAIADAQEHASGLDFVIGMEFRYSALSEEEKTIKSLSSRYSRLEDICDGYSDTESEISKLEAIISLKADIEELSESAESIKELDSHIKDLSSLLLSHEEIGEDIESTSHIAAFQDSLDVLMEDKSRIDAVSSTHSDLHTHLERMDDLDAEMSTLDELESDIKEWMKENAPSECPYCGSKL
jgi:exonuclease SbcC